MQRNSPPADSTFHFANTNANTPADIMPPVPPGLEIRGKKAPPTPGHGSRGRGLFATRSFTPGQALGIFHKPIIALPSRLDAKTVCNHCLDPRRVPLKLCTGCRAVAYCGPVCQRAHWDLFHKLECKPLKAAFASAATETVMGAVVQPLPAPVRALVQLLQLWRRSSEIREMLEELENNMLAFRAKPELCEDFRLQAAMACKLISWTGDVQIAQGLWQLCRIHTNAFDRSDKDMGLTGIFLDVTLAMVNHSCMANAVVVFSGRKAYLRAQVPIAAGDEITISYTDCTEPLSVRKQKLEPYNFECTCPRCRDNLDVYQAAQISAALSLNTCATHPPLDGSSSSWKTFSLVANLDLLREPPVNRDGPLAVTAQQAEAIWTASRSIVTKPVVGGAHRLEDMYQVWELCTPLIAAERWADEPLAWVVQQALLYYIDVGNYAHALVFACFSAQYIDPYKYPAPFATWRNMGLLTIAKCLAMSLPLVMPDRPVEAGGDGGQAKREARGQGGPHADRRRIVDNRIFEDLTFLFKSGGLYMALLVMALHNAPLGHSEDWPPVSDVRERLADFRAWQGEEMWDLVNEWYADPSSRRSMSFTKIHILFPLKRLSSLAPELLDMIFWTSIKNYRRKTGDIIPPARC